MNDIYIHALKLLRKRDYTVWELREKIEARFHEIPDEIIDRLIQKNFLNDRRFTENYVARRQYQGKALLREELTSRGVASDLIDEILSKTAWPSLQEALADKMNGWKLGAPLQPRDATRLFRALLRLGYDEDAVREEIEQLREP